MIIEVDFNKKKVINIVDEINEKADSSDKILEDSMKIYEETMKLLYGYTSEKTFRETIRKKELRLLT